MDARVSTQPTAFVELTDQSRAGPQVDIAGARLPVTRGFRDEKSHVLAHHSKANHRDHRCNLRRDRLCGSAAPSAGWLD